MRAEIPMYSLFGVVELSVGIMHAPSTHTPLVPLLYCKIQRPLSHSPPPTPLFFYIYLDFNIK